MGASSNRLKAVVSSACRLEKEFETMKKPRRAYKLTLELNADKLKDLLNSLEHIIFTIDVYDTRNSVSGGYSSGYILDIDIDETITHDKYMEDVRQYLATKKDAPPPTPSDNPPRSTNL